MVVKWLRFNFVESGCIIIIMLMRFMRIVIV